MNGQYCKCIGEHKHQIQAAWSWWKIPCRSCQLAWDTGIRTCTVLNYTAGLLPELVNHDRFVEILLQDFFFFFFVILIKCFQNIKPKPAVLFRFFFIFPICNYFFAHLSYTWSIVQLLAKNGVTGKTPLITVQCRKCMNIIEEKVMWYRLPQASCLNYYKPICSKKGLAECQEECVLPPCWS